MAINPPTRAITKVMTPGLRKKSPLPPLLNLPLEVRDQIYNYILPSAITSTSPKGLVRSTWTLGQTAPLCVSHQLHAETTSLIYGTNLFVIDVGYGYICFQFRTKLKNGLIRSLTPAFPEWLGKEGRRRLEKVLVNVDHVDSYTGMIKYNCGGQGLTDGLKLQVQKVVDVLSGCDELRYLHINLRDWNNNPEVAQTVLEPFAMLENAEDAVLVTGDVDEDFAERLKAMVIGVKVVDTNGDFGVKGH